eukprot:CAMPEP_0117556172 /NCGR_PEP_ID=MMETSP0784-20121206/51664_1 /TAXON_ID=39447 /ORGANISM="" /LENGTH=608 /DNA_ID=CAMNT_0005353423 /DNA_START=1 /DNA_END=1823 /DNA_ORIENTATION=+
MAVDYARLQRFKIEEEGDATEEVAHSEDDEETPGKKLNRGIVVAVGLVALVVFVVCVLTNLRPRGAGGQSPSLPPAGGGDEAPPTVTPEEDELLTLVDRELLSRPQFQNGLLQTFGPGNFGGGSCGEKCTLPDDCPAQNAMKLCRFDIYDNALVAIYFSMRGKLDSARPIIDAFMSLLYPHGSVDSLDLDTVYDGASRGMPSRRKLTLLASAYANQVLKAGVYDANAGVLEDTIDTGNNAWVALAFVHYAAATGQKCYMIPAYDIMYALAGSTQCEDALNGFMSRLAPTQKYYRATDDNIVMYVLGSFLRNSSVMARASQFVRGMYGKNPLNATMYAMGTGDATLCDANLPDPETDVPFPATAQFWNELAAVDRDPVRKVSALNAAWEPVGAGGLRQVDVDYIGNNHGEGVGKYTGFRYSSLGHGVQWEVSAAAAMALVQFRSGGNDLSPAQEEGVTNTIEQVRDSIRRILKVYGAVPASVRGGNAAAFEDSRMSGNYDLGTEFPGGTETGIPPMPTAFFRYPHLAATAWTGMLMLMQGDSDAPYNKWANPFVIDFSKLPDDVYEALTDKSCLNPEMPRMCADNAGCVGKEGRCCPDDYGVYDECCKA